MYGLEDLDFPERGEHHRDGDPGSNPLGALTIRFHGDEPGSLVISDVLAERTGLRAGDTISFTNVTTEFTSRITGEIHVSNDSLGAIGGAVTRREHVRNE